MGSWDGNGHRARQLRKRVIAHYTHCALCGKPVDKTLRTPDPGSPEVDHKTPISLGGDPLAWSNCQLAHRACNIEKSNRLTVKPPAARRPPPQPVTSRDW